MSKYLKFEELPNPVGKTRRFRVLNTKGESLGWIHWRSGWRRYVFGVGTVVEFDPACLIAISEFLLKLMEERKK